jgi:hypothetical protein
VSIPVSNAQQTLDQRAPVSTALHDDGGEWYTARKRMEEFFSKNHNKEYSTRQVAAAFGIDLKLTGSVLFSLEKAEDIVNVGDVGLGSELWRYKRQPGKSWRLPESNGGFLPFQIVRL